MTSCEGGVPGFDPWAATQLGALQAQDDCCELRGTPHDPLFRWTAARVVEAQRQACEDTAGGRAVLECLGLCLSHALPVPAWLGEQFGARLQRVNRGEALSWDEAFGGRPWPRGTRRAKLARDLRLMPLVMSAALEMCGAEPTRAVTLDLFEEIGERRDVALSGPSVKRLYYAAIREGIHPGVVAESLAHGGAAKSRKPRNTDPAKRHAPRDISAQRTA